MTGTIVLINNTEINVNEPNYISENDRGVTHVIKRGDTANDQTFFPWTSVLSVTKRYPES